MISTVELRELAIEFFGAHPFLADPSEAAGRCFWSAMAFAWWAEDRGYQVEVIRWRVAGDPHFNDHWAVILAGSLVIDHTRAQVDGQTGIFWRITDYPRNYFAPRCYPASLLLANFKRQQHEADGQLPPAYMAAVTAVLAGYDAGRFPQPPVPHQVWGLIALALAFFVWRLVA